MYQEYRFHDDCWWYRGKPDGEWHRMAGPPNLTGRDPALSAAPEPQAEPDQVLAGDGKPCHGYGLRQDGTAVCFWPDCNCRGDDAEPVESTDARAAHRLWCEGIIATQQFASNLAQTHLACDSAELLAYVNARRPAEQTEPAVHCVRCAGDAPLCEHHAGVAAGEAILRGMTKADTEPADGGEVEWLAQWLEANSSGVYRNCSLAAALLRTQAARIAELEAVIADVQRAMFPGGRE